MANPATAVGGLSRAKLGIVGLGPIHQELGHIGVAVAQGAEFPVEHGQHLAVGAQDAVVEPVVAVDDAGLALLGDAGHQMVVNLSHLGPVPGLGLLELAQPAAKLAGDVILLAAEVAQPHLVDVHRVDPGQGGGNRPGGSPAQLGGEAGSLRLVPHHLSLHEVHHVEGTLVDRLVLAQAECLGHRHVGVGQRGDDLVLSAHVVGGGQHLGKRGSAQHVGPAVGAGGLEGEVGVPAGDQFEGEGQNDIGHMGLEPRAHRVELDASDVVHAKGHASFHWGLLAIPERGNSWLM